MRIRNERVAWREVDGEIVALDIEQSRYFTANGTASVLIKRLDAGGASEEGLCAALVAEFEVDADTAASDVARFLRLLDDQGLLDREDN